jgi:hypothetical protein
MAFLRRAALSLVATWALVATLAITAAPAAAEEPLHHVRYTVTAEIPWTADIYYHDIDPPDWSTYSHNSYQFTPKVEAHVGPGQTWTLDVMLADPRMWAMVVATSGLDPVTPNFHCSLELDGAVVVTRQGPKGAMCALRPW